MKASGKFETSAGEYRRKGMGRNQDRASHFSGSPVQVAEPGDKKGKGDHEGRPQGASVVCADSAAVRRGSKRRGYG